MRDLGGAYRGKHAGAHRRDGPGRRHGSAAALSGGGSRWARALVPSHRRGAACGADGPMSQQINLYSPLFRKQKKLFTALAMVQALGIVVIALVGLYGYARVQVTELAGQARDSDT